MSDLFEKLKSLTSYTPVKVVFTKVNGQERTMVCSREPKFYSDYEFKEGGNKPENPSDTTLTVWDLGVGNWRAIRKESIKSVEIFST